VSVNLDDFVRETLLAIRRSPSAGEGARARRDN
jgi:hypothetical protein